MPPERAEAEPSDRAGARPPARARSARRAVGRTGERGGWARERTRGRALLGVGALRLMIPLASDIAQTMRDGFDTHYRLFRETSAAAKQRFEQGDWASWVREASKARIQMVRPAGRGSRGRPARALSGRAAGRVALAGDQARCTSASSTSTGSPECAETFFNSGRLPRARPAPLLPPRARYIFARPGPLDRAPRRRRAHVPRLLPDEGRPAPQPSSTSCRASRSRARSRISTGTSATSSIRCASTSRGKWRVLPNFSDPGPLVALLSQQGRVSGRPGAQRERDLSVPRHAAPQGRARRHLRRRAPPQGGEHRPRLQPGALVLHGRHGSPSASTWRSSRRSCRGASRRPSSTRCWACRSRSKTHFYRDLIEHMKHSTDTFVTAPGTKGLVMVVFTCPSFPRYVFKVIRDWFEPPASRAIGGGSRRSTLLCQVPRPRRANGRHALEYSNVALPPSTRFDPCARRGVLRRVAASSVEIDAGDQLVHPPRVHRAAQWCRWTCTSATRTKPPRDTASTSTARRSRSSRARTSSRETCSSK